MATHKEMVEIAAKWLKYRCVIPYEYHDGEIKASKSLCGVVATEIVTAAMETPDAIGWHCGTSIVIECKVSRSDYYRDKSKYFRNRPQYGVGDYRYYMTPAGLLVQKNLPDKWGLLEVTGKKVEVVKLAERQESNNKGERRILLSIIRRLMAKESLV